MELINVHFVGTRRLFFFFFYESPARDDSGIQLPLVTIYLDRASNPDRVHQVDRSSLPGARQGQAQGSGDGARRQSGRSGAESVGGA